MVDPANVDAAVADITLLATLTAIVAAVDAVTVDVVDVMVIVDYLQSLNSYRYTQLIKIFFNTLHFDLIK